MSAQLLIQLNSPHLMHRSGSQDAHANRVCASQNMEPHSLVFVSLKEELLKAIEKRASIIICDEKVFSHNLNLIELAPDQCLFSTSQIPLAMSLIFSQIDDKRTRVAHGISNQASIHPTAKIGKNVNIAPFAVIGEHCIVGDGATISSHVTIENHAAIGEHTYLHPQVVIGARCKVGAHCEIHSCTVIGSDGFGYALNSPNSFKKIPQLGIVVIEDDVEIGANCSIDRATITETIIGKGTKLDNQIHIAHNCKIGENCRLTAGFRIAGSSQIGSNFLCGGGVLVTDHVHICPDVTLAGNSIVTNDIEKPGAYGGYPLEPLRDALKTIANLANLTKMRKKLDAISKHLGMNESANEQLKK